MSGPPPAEPQHRVVVIIDNVAYRDTVSHSLLVNKEGQCVLPKNMHSAGWTERVWDVQWDSLPPVPRD